MLLLAPVNNSIFFWKKAPFVKLVPALALGILLQWYFPIPILSWLFGLVLSLLLFSLFFFLPFFNRFKLLPVAGILVSACFISIGALLVIRHDIRLEKNWFGKNYPSNDFLIARIEEPLVEKTNSFKAIVSIRYRIRDSASIKVQGRAILYFKKDSSVKQINYGTTLLLRKQLLPIQNSGNPHGFNYQRYCLFQGITHQLYVTTKDYLVLPKNDRSFFRGFILDAKEKIMSVLRRYIPGQKECGLAEALLIGYKNDLDKSLVQSYTNTGVVHIIAISGLHLGLIYWLLALLSKPLLRQKKWRWLRPILIIGSLWLFSIMAGAQASVLRSALMFTCIVLGESLSRKTSIYNTLAFSAFILLCINPFTLWDVGFQLSYAAVLSIIIFFQPIYNWFYIKNKILDFLWKLNAVTLAAQILTIPFCIYHFHQFPNYFLLTNIVAVPLSSLILLGEIFLCVISWWQGLALLVGKLLKFLIFCMNTWIEKIEQLPLSVWPGLQVSLVQTVLLVLLAAFLGYWLLEKNKASLYISLLSLLLFCTLRSISFLQSKQQQKIIVYNLPKKTGADLIDGRKYFFAGDSEIINDDFIRNFHLQPARIAHRLGHPSIHSSTPNHAFSIGNKNLLILSKPLRMETNENKPVIEVLLLIKNCRQPIAQLRSVFDIRKIIFDASSSPRKIERWRRECDSLGIKYHDVTTQGAFVMSLR